MKLIHILLLLLMPTTVMAQNAEPLPLSEVQKPLYFHTYYNPVTVMVGDKDSPHTSVPFFDDKIDLSDWGKGEEVNFVILDTEGAGFVRRKTGKFYKIMMSDSTLISDWKTDCIEKSVESSYFCDTEIINFWKKEQKLLFKHLYERNDAAFQKDLDQAEQNWVAYRDSIYKFRGNSMNMDMVLRLEKDHYDHLVLLANVY